LKCARVRVACESKRNIIIMRDPARLLYL